MADKIFHTWFTQKTNPIWADKIMISDSQASNETKFTQITNLPINTATQIALDNKVDNVVAWTNTTVTRSGNVITVSSLWWPAVVTDWFNRNYFVSTEWQTEFTATFNFTENTWSVIVILNWQVLKPTLDYTEPWLNKVVFVSPLVAWEEIQLITGIKWDQWPKWDKGDKGDKWDTWEQGIQGIQGEVWPIWPTWPQWPAWVDWVWIDNIELISTVWKVKTYRITYTDATTFDYTVSDWNDSIALSPAYTVINTLNDRILNWDNISLNELVDIVWTMIWDLRMYSWLGWNAPLFIQDVEPSVTVPSLWIDTSWWNYSFNLVTP